MGRGDYYSRERIGRCYSSVGANNSSQFRPSSLKTNHRSAKTDSGNYFSRKGWPRVCQPFNVVFQRIRVGKSVFPSDPSFFESKELTFALFRADRFIAAIRITRARETVNNIVYTSRYVCVYTHVPLNRTFDSFVYIGYRCRQNVTNDRTIRNEQGNAPSK